ncbi:MAG: hypothetical protein ABWZ55_09870 [Acidimicrobiales bacterium]
MRKAWWGLVVALAALPACGGDDGGRGERVAPDEWVSVVCAEVAGATADLGAALAVIDGLPAEVEPDAALGEHADTLREAFLALPDFVERYRHVVADTPAPDTADGAAFREELLADLDEAAATFGAAADAAGLLDEDTTAEELFSGAQAFGEFPAAFADADLDFGEDVPPGVAEAQAADDTCRDTQNQLVAVLGG